MKSLGCSIYHIVSSSCNDSFTSFLSVWWIPFVVFLTWLLWLGFTILCWRDVMTVGIVVLFQILAGRLSAFHHCYYILCGLVINNFYCFEIRFLCTHFDKNFYRDWMLNFVTCFSCTSWDDHVVFVFCLCGVSHWLVCMCWTILVNLGWMPRVCDLFLCGIGLSLLILCWVNHGIKR